VLRPFYDGPLITIKPWYLPAIRCTPNHKILAASSADKRPTKIQAHYLTKKNYVTIPKITEPNKTITIDLASFLGKVSLPKYKRIRSSRQWRLNRSTLEKISYLTGRGLTSREIGQRLNLHPATIRSTRSRLSRSNPAQLSNEYGPYKIIASSVPSKSVLRNAVGVSAFYLTLKVVEPVPEVYPVKEAVATTLYTPLGAENVTMYLNIALP